MNTVLELPRISAQQLLEHPHRDDFELVDGDLVERNTGWMSSRLGFLLGTWLNQHVLAHNLGWVNGADAAYRCFESACPDDPERIRKPDLSFISIVRLSPDDEPKGYCNIVPDLAVEVVSPHDLAYEIVEKVEEYLRAGVKLVWVIMPPTKSIEVRRVDGSYELLHEGDELSGEDVVPGFKCAVSDIFRPLRKATPLTD